MIATLWTDWFELWTMRNEDRHGKNKNEQTKAIRAQTIREVTALYDKAEDMDPSDLDIFDQSLETMIEDTTASLFSWKSNWERIINASVVRQQSRLGEQQQHHEQTQHTQQDDNM